jgi:hypothetical protein
MKKPGQLIGACLSFFLFIVSAHAVFPPGNTNLVRTLETWSFNDTTTWTNDHGFLPISFTNLGWSLLGDNTCLVVDSTDPAWLQYHVTEVSGTNNLRVDEGTLMFWFAPNWTDTNHSGTGPGGFGRFIDVGSYTSDASYGWWSFYLDPAGTNVYFAAQTNNGSQAVFLSAPVSCDTTNYWHMFALTYSPTGSAFYLDGLFVTNGGPVTIWPSPSVLTNGVYIGSDNSGLAQAHGMFDDVATYDRPLPAGTIATAYIFSSFLYHGNSLNPANRIASPTWQQTNSITGPGYLRPIGTITNGCVSSSGVWLTNVAVSMTNNGTVNVAFTVAGGSDGINYDVFATGALEYPITNALWAWMGQVNHCTRYLMTNLPPYSAYIILGTPLDSDSDGLTDAFEKLVSHTDPNNLDTYGIGISDGFQWGYFAQGNLDPYALCPSGDGWSIVDAFENGWDPYDFHTPAAPVRVTANMNILNSTVTLSWQPCSGTVTGYTVMRFEPATSTEVDFNVGSSAQLVDTTFPPYPRTPVQIGIYDAPYYRVTAHYPQSDSNPSQPVSPYSLSDLPQGNVVLGAAGTTMLQINTMPSDATGVRVTRLVVDSSNPNFYSSATNRDFPLSSLTNGTLLLTGDLAEYGLEGDEWILQTLWTNRPPSSRSDGGNLALAFIDGRTQLVQNATFLLRASTVSAPVFYNLGTSLVLQPTNYTYAGYYSPNWDLDPSDLGDASWPDGYRPFAENYRYFNCVFATSNVDATGFLNTGYQSPWSLQPPLKNAFPTPIATELVPGLLSVSQCRWMMPWDPSSFGVTNISNHFFLSNNTRNWFGLPLASVLLAHWNAINGVRYDVLTNGASILVATNDSYIFYPEFAQPSFQNTGYYFGQSVNLATGNSVAFDPMPGDPDFLPTNSSSVELAGVGQPFQAALFAANKVTNGDQNKPVYIQQYFDAAYKIDSNGTPTGVTGSLNPMGLFYPSEPGLTALASLPDAISGQRGTGFVWAASLQLDANHDGTMDLNSSGLDSVTPAKPFRFWVNNDYDAPGLYGDPDSDLFVPGSPDYNYTNSSFGNGVYCIHSKRDLEDYARLWICGIPPLTNSGYNVTLSWYVSSGHPVIRLFQSVETNGGTLYLTDTNIAASQIAVTAYTNGSYYFPGPGVSIGTVSPETPFTLPSAFFTNGATRYLLFEGAGIGAGQLLLTVARSSGQNSNVLAQTSTWLDLHDVKDFFERAYATNVTSGKPPSSLVSDFRLIKAIPPQPDEAKQIIVFVHGINNTDWGYESSSATMFKRLYWSGYHGRFAAFRWPCAYLPPNTANPYLFDLGEFYAFKSATALKNYLNYLKNSRADLSGYGLNIYAHSQGAVVASEALLQGASCDNCVLSQGAFPAHCYDTNAPFLQDLWDSETNSVNAMQTPFYTTNGGYHGYCLPIHTDMINFYNTNDFALATGTTGPFDTNWEADQRTLKPHAFVGGPSYIYYPSNFATVAYYTFGSHYTVTDSQEIKALVARSRSSAVGAQAGLAGVIHGSVNLGSSAFGFGRTRTEHSAQFDRPIQTVWGYYDEILVSFGIPLTVNR